MRNVINLNVVGTFHFFGISRNAFICPSIASQEAIFTPIKPPFSQRARHAEADVVIGRGTFDLNAVKN